MFTPNSEMGVDANEVKTEEWSDFVRRMRDRVDQIENDNAEEVRNLGADPVRLLAMRVFLLEERIEKIKNNYPNVVG